MMNLSWYDTLNKPPFTPPSSVFAPAWTLLYILMFLALVIFLSQDCTESKAGGLILFVIQFVLNLLWSPVFFYWHNIEFAFVLIILLIFFVLATIAAFYKVSRVAALLLIPYMLWLLFASYLNWGVLLMN